MLAAMLWRWFFCLTNNSQWWWLFRIRFFFSCYVLLHFQSLGNIFLPFWHTQTGIFFLACAHNSLSYRIGIFSNENKWIRKTRSEFFFSSFSLQNFILCKSNAIKFFFSCAFIFARVVHDATTNLKLFTSKVLIQLRVNDVMHRAASIRFAFLSVHFFFFHSYNRNRNRKTKYTNNNTIWTVCGARHRKVGSVYTVRLCMVIHVCYGWFVVQDKFQNKWVVIVVTLLLLL